MMRHHSTLALGLAVLFVVPTALPSSQEPINLRERLEATLAALKHLGGLDHRIQAGGEGVIEELVSATEPAIEDGMWADEQLTLLRTEVAALQQRWDELSTSGFSVTPAVGGTMALHTFQLPLPGDGGPSPRSEFETHVGLDSAARTAIRGLVSPRVATAEAVDGDPADPDPTRPFEEDEYSADTLREGRLLARSRRWTEAYALLKPHADQPEVRYWIARCHEGLGQRAQAIDIYQALLQAGQPDKETGTEASAEARTLARRAGYDLRFLELKRELDGRKKSGSEQGGAK